MEKHRDELEAHARALMKFLPMKKQEKILIMSCYKSEAVYLASDDNDLVYRTIRSQIKYWKRMIPCITMEATTYRTQKFKEELMMKAWHPDRVAKWVEADRWDLLD